MFVQLKAITKRSCSDQNLLTWLKIRKVFDGMCGKIAKSAGQNKTSRKIFFFFLSYHKDQRLSLHEESKLRHSNSAPQCPGTQLQKLTVNKAPYRYHPALCQSQLCKKPRVNRKGKDTNFELCNETMKEDFSSEISFLSCWAQNSRTIRVSRQMYPAAAAAYYHNPFLVQFIYSFVKDR